MNTSSCYITAEPQKIRILPTDNQQFVQIKTEKGGQGCLYLEDGSLIHHGDGSYTYPDGVIEGCVSPIKE